MSSLFAQAVLGAKTTLLAQLGEPITYTPTGGTPVQTVALPAGAANILQSSAPGYFMDVEIDPLVVTTPLRGDIVTWSNGTAYIVAKVAIPDIYGLFILALHRQTDPPPGTPA
jgi:hypothetical protein